MAGAGLGIMDDAVSDTGGQTAQKLGVGMVQGPQSRQTWQQPAAATTSDDPLMNLLKACSWPSKNAS